MSRVASRIYHDEVERLVKPLMDLGLPIARVCWDDGVLSVIIGDSGEKVSAAIDGPELADKPIREPQL